jgi:hypothetical protein
VAVEEHFVEAAHYAKDGERTARLHFTLSPEHIEKFNAKKAEVIGSYEQVFDVHFEITHSIQKKSTDIIAVDEENRPVRNPDGSLLFRPGGHGALLDNLNAIDADLVFVKNIDNIVPDRLKIATIEYKKLIGGYLLYIRDTIFDFLKKEEKNSLSDEEVAIMADFSQHTLHIEFPDDFRAQSPSGQKAFLKQALNRPIRICGMVKNEGEPGGGPFWVTGKEGKKSLQIVESSQIDFSDYEQKKIVEHSTHFNPVDLVCSIKDFKGATYDLSRFVDPDTGFIAIKSSGGKTLKAQELPGLWNGAMAEWITLFVEVPVITFNPVKTINDLLRKEHQP